MEKLLTDPMKSLPGTCLLDPKRRLARNSCVRSNGICFFLSTHPKRWRCNQLHPKPKILSPTTNTHPEYHPNVHVIA